MNDKEIQWHPPYIAAMNLELADDRDAFRFEPEYVLNTGALKIDLFVESRKRVCRFHTGSSFKSKQRISRTIKE